MQVLGKYLIVFGIVMSALGGIFLLIGKVPWIGRLPGDILIKKEHFTVYIPVATCVLISIILSLLFYMFSKK